MKTGAWIHTHDGFALDEQIALAAEFGLQTIRSYTLEYTEQALPMIKQTGMSLLAGVTVNAAKLRGNWRSQVRLDEIARYHELDLPIEAICVGNELGEKPHGSEGRKLLTARLSFGLANVLATYRQWLDERGLGTPLTYAMEGGEALGHEGIFHEWLWPLIDACDVVSVNLYPMGYQDWFTFGAFEESRLFLHDSRVRKRRLALFELELRRVLDQLASVDKPLILSETGFPSATAYRKEDDLIIPENDDVRYAELMPEFVNLIRSIDADYGGRIQALYFYEWRDNFYHTKILQVDSPIHVAFGLCDHTGEPKLDIRRLLVGIDQTPAHG
jgi:hypothetical protein